MGGGGQRVHLTRAATAAVLAALTLAGCGSATSTSAASGPLPMITPADRWNDRPLAGVSGPLTLRADCLLLDGEIVFWLHGTRWDDDEQEVVFEEGGSVRVGEQFDGGGGHWDLGGDVDGPLDVESWLGEDAGAAIRSCSEETGVTALVFAYPAPAPS